MSRAPRKLPSFDVDALDVASPCSVPWDSMQGDERRRFCGLCEKHVYDLRFLTRDEVAELFATYGEDGAVCGRLFRRADGTVLTADCPVGLAARLRRRISAGVGALVAALAAVFAWLPTPASGSTPLPRKRTDTPARTICDDVVYEVAGGLRPMPPRSESPGLTSFRDDPEAWTADARTVTEAVLDVAGRAARRR